MAKPLDREMIQDEALSVFARLGLRRASISDIVSSLGVGKTAIYHHFPGGKAEIIDTCLEREEQAILLAMLRAVEDPKDPREQLRAMVVGKIDKMRRLREVREMSGDVGRDIEQIIRNHETRFNQAHESLIETIVIDGQTRGIFKSSDPRRLTRSLRGLFDHLEIEIASDSRSDTRQEQLDTFFEILFHGLVSTHQREKDSS